MNDTRFKELLEEKKYLILKNELLEQNEVDIAVFMEEIPEDKVLLVFRMLPKDLAVEVFANLSEDMQQLLISRSTDAEIAEIMNELALDDAVDLIETLMDEMPAGFVKRVLANAGPDTRELINQFLKYPEYSAGSIMTIEYVNLKADFTVEDAFKKIRRTGVDRETIYTCYVTDESRILVGIVTVRTLLLSELDDNISDIMETNIISVKTGDDQEAVAHLFSKYDFTSVPVVDYENRLVGIITIDDVIDVVHEEATEDFEKMAAILPSEKPYLKTSVLSLTKNRIPWLLILMITGLITGAILGSYESAMAAIPLLVTFIPMLTDTGGNAGSQSSTLIIRGMALHEIEMKDILRVLFKELRVGILAGLVLSAVNFLRVWIQYPGQQMIALTLGLAVMMTVIIAKTVGAMLPMLAKLVHADPAIMAAPLITTIVDAFALVLYFTFAKILLGV